MIVRVMIRKMEIKRKRKKMMITTNWKNKI